MPRLDDLARQGRQTDFEKKWAEDNNKPYPLTIPDGILATAEYNRYRTTSSTTTSTTSSNTTSTGKASNVFESIKNLQLVTSQHNKNKNICLR